MYPAYNIPLDTEEMKTCVLGAQVDDRLKKYMPDTFDKSNWINKYVRFYSPLLLFKNPGEKSFKTIDAGRHVGYITGFNSKGNWVKLKSPLYDNEVWFLAEALNSVSKTEDRKGYLTEEEKEFAKQVAFSAAGAVTPMATVGKKAFETSLVVAEGVGDVAQSGLSVITFVGKNLKWILLGVALIALAYFVLQFKKTM